MQSKQACAAKFQILNRKAGFGADFDKLRRKYERK